MIDMDRNEFTRQLKDLLPRLHDISVLETHPLVDVFQPTQEVQGSPGENLQDLFFRAIEKLQPKGIQATPAAVEWRPYLILHKRYVEGLSLQELSTDLSLSERQIRRDHNRAVLALAGRLWDQVFQNGVPSSPRHAQESETARETGYELLAEVLDLNELVRGAANIMRLRLEEEEVELELQLSPKPPQAVSDRIVLRQVLFSLFKYALHLLDGKYLRIVVSPEGLIRYQFQVDRDWKYWRQEEHEDLLESVMKWVHRMNAEVLESYPPPGKAGQAELRLVLMLPTRPTVMVVDDQQPALRMFQRFLSRSGFEVVGVTDPALVLPLARQLEPVLITLDVMMPHLDGWEVLQALQLDEKTRQVPVIVCSAWEEPELARSLGAAAFLKKPIVRSDLLNALDQLKII
jgi:CheY-like chemotaxis protein